MICSSLVPENFFFSGTSQNFLIMCVINYSVPSRSRFDLERYGDGHFWDSSSATQTDNIRRSHKRSESHKTTRSSNHISCVVQSPVE